MEESEESGPKTASIRSHLEQAREPLSDWTPSIELTQPVKLLAGTDITDTGSVARANVASDFLFENIPAMIWIKDRENNVVKVNRWAAKAMGAPAEELEGKSEWDLHPDRADQYYADDRKVIHSKRPIYGIVETFETGDGGDLSVVTDRIPILDSQGEVKGIVVITRDISKQREAETKLVESQERLELALWGAEMGSWDLFIKENKFNLDQRAAQILGLPDGQQEISFEALAEFAHPDDLAPLGRSLGRHLEDEADVFEAEWRLTDGEGGWRWVLQKGRIVERTASGKPMRVSGTVLDIMRRKEMEEEHDALERQMQHTQKLESLGVLAGGIAHDFNNLLTGILSQSGIARIELSKGRAAVDDHLEKIEAAARRMAQLTRQMLAYSGRGKFEIRRFDLNEVIHEIVYLLKASIGKKANYKMDLSEEPIYVEGDAAQIHQVLLNLVTNASDAIGEDRGTIVLRTGFTDLKTEDLQQVPWGNELSPGKFVFVEVEDDGCGMDEETQRRLFEPFFTTKFSGRGLGMSAVLGIVRSHGGLIKVKTAPGAGTIFRVYNPASAPPEQVAVSAQKSPANKVAAGSKYLIIDDELIVRSVFSQAIKALGYEYEEAADGPTAIDLFRKRQKDVSEKGRFQGVFLDMTMPEMNGYEVYQELQAIDPSVSVCIMSGFAAEEISTQFEKEKVLSFLPKPFQLEDIQAAIQKMGEVA